MPNQTSEKLFQKAKEIIPGGVNSPVRAFRAVGGTPFFTIRAEGSQLITADNQTLIDYVCTWGPAIHGHNHPYIRNEIARALGKGTSFGTPNPYEVEMAQRIVNLVPSIEKVRMTNSGTEATMSSIRLARGYTGRDKIIKFTGCYHGHVDSLLVKAGSGALTLGNPDSAGIPADFTRHTILLPYNDHEKVEVAFKKYGDEIAAIIIEPYPANCGLILPQNQFLQKLRSLCDSHQSLLIFDEVMTGFRIAPGGVQEKLGITPDITALGKIIGGGLPVGAFGGKADIMNYLAPNGPVYQAGTLSGNPLAMAAGIASLQILKEEDPYDSLESKGTFLSKAISDTAKEKGIPLQVPHAGSMFCLYFTEERVDNFESATSCNLEHYRKLFQFCLSKGVYLPPSAYETAFISTKHSQLDMETTVDIIRQGLKLI